MVNRRRVLGPLRIRLRVRGKRNSRTSRIVQLLSKITHLAPTPSESRLTVGLFDVKKFGIGCNRREIYERKDRPEGSREGRV